MRFKNGPQLPGAGRKRAGHHHGSHTPTSLGTISLGKMAYHTKQIHRECIYKTKGHVHSYMSFPQNATPYRVQNCGYIISVFQEAPSFNQAQRYQLLLLWYI